MYTFIVSCLLVLIFSSSTLAFLVVVVLASWAIPIEKIHFKITSIPLHIYFRIETNVHLDGVIYEPLQSREGTDHHDSRSETLPYTTPSKFTYYGSDCRCTVLLTVKKLSLLESKYLDESVSYLVEFGHDGIGGMRYDGTEDTGNVTGGESDDQLFSLGALIAWFGYNVPILKKLIYRSWTLNDSIWFYIYL